MLEVARDACSPAFSMASEKAETVGQARSGCRAASRRAACARPGPRRSGRRRSAGSDWPAHFSVGKGASLSREMRRRCPRPSVKSSSPTGRRYRRRSARDAGPLSDRSCRQSASVQSIALQFDRCQQVSRKRLLCAATLTASRPWCARSLQQRLGARRASRYRPRSQRCGLDAHIVRPHGADRRAAAGVAAAGIGRL